MATDPTEPPRTATPTGTTHASLVERAKNIITQPKAEWPRIDAEPDTIGDIYKRYVVILAAIPPVALLIGMLVFGVSFLGITYRPSPGSAIAQALISYLLALAGVYVLALIIEALAPTFGGTKDRVKAFKVAAYASTAGWLAGIFGILPALAWLAIIGGLYSLYLFYLGIPVLMKVAEDKALGYTIAVIVAAIVLYLVIGYIAAALVGSIVGMPGPGAGSITVNVPG